MTDLDMINMDQPDDIDTSAMMRHAHARERRLESYDPHRLAREIAELLRERGLHPDDTGRAGTAAGAVSHLLRSFGILPAWDYTHESPDDW